MVESRRLGVWTDGPEAVIEGRILAPSGRDLALEARVEGFVAPAHPQVSVGVFVNSTWVGQWVFRYDDKPRTIRSVRIPAEILQSASALDILFRIDRPQSPAALGMSTDGRLLGLALEMMRISVEESTNERP